MARLPVIVLVLAATLAFATLAGCLGTQGNPRSPTPTVGSPSPTPSPSVRPGSPAPTPPTLPIFQGPAPKQIGHVFLIVLENKGFNATFGPSSKAPYLGKELPAIGKLLPQYYGIGHNSLGNYVAMVSGQAPNTQTQADCPAFLDFASSATSPLDGQAVGQGCVYPPAVKTIGDQLQAAGKTWRAYAEDMASPGAPAACRHPPLNSQDQWQGASAQDQYATRHVSFVYFHSIIDNDASCKEHVVDLSLFLGDLQRVETTPAFSFVSPDLCSDGHDEPCADGRAGGYASIDEFLQVWVPRIIASPAYGQDGLLIVTFDEGDDASACCNEPTGPNTAMPGIRGPGGGRTGAVLLSRCLDPGSTDDTPHNHYSLLRTLEDVFGLPHLGYAGQAGLKPIDLGRCATGA